MPTMIVQTTGPAIGTALIQARRCGYRDAIDAMREMADDYSDLQVRKAIQEIARTLKTSRP